MWQYHDSKLKELKALYNKISKQTQNNLQTLLDTFQFSFDNLYSIADNKTKRRINTYIEEWQDKGLLNGYFGMLANNIYKRTRVKNSEILELLIYSAYIEEQSKVEQEELNTFKNIANYYYQEGQKEVYKTLPKKKQQPSVIPDAIFLALLDMPNSKGYVWNQYIDAILKYNADQLYRQITIDLQQQKEINITDDVYQNIIKKQQNTKLNINGDKVSGDIDLTLLGLNNQAKIEGIKSVDNDAKVIFLSNLDGTETPMCHSLNNQEFYINKENEFNRYYGENPKELSIRKIKCFGLVLGLNLPPINHHFHWCRSIVQYIPPKLEKEEKTGYNGLASNKSNNVKLHQKPVLLENINYNNTKEVNETLEYYEQKIMNDKVENAIVITTDGEVYQCYGDEKNVWPDYDLGDKLHNAYMTHNHPIKETQYSFSEDDIALFNNYELKELRGIDKKYTYELSRKSKEIDELTIEDMLNEENGLHALNINRATRMNIGYRRWKND